MAPLELDAVVVEGDAQASLSKVSSVSKRSPFRIPPLVRTKDDEPEDEKDEDRVGGDEEKRPRPRRCRRRVSSRRCAWR